MSTSNKKSEVIDLRAFTDNKQEVNPQYPGTGVEHLLQFIKDESKPKDPKPTPSAPVNNGKTDDKQTTLNNPKTTNNKKSTNNPTTPPNNKTKTRRNNKKKVEEEVPVVQQTMTASK